MGRVTSPRSTSPVVTRSHGPCPHQIPLMDADEATAHLLGHLVQLAVKGIAPPGRDAGDLPPVRDKVENTALGDAVGDISAAAEKDLILLPVEDCGGPLEDLLQLLGFGGF